MESAEKSQQQKLFIKNKLGRLVEFKVEDEVAVYIRMLENAIIDEDDTKIKKAYPHRFVSSKRKYRSEEYIKNEKLRNEKPIVVELK